MVNVRSHKRRLKNKTVTINSYNRDSVYRKYKNNTNMTLSELKRWYKNQCSKKASLDRKPIERNLKLLSKPKDNWNEQDITEANKVISFNSRMKKVKRGKIVKGCKLSKRDISLKNWAFDPDKK